MCAMESRVVCEGCRRGRVGMNELLWREAVFCCIKEEAVVVHWWRLVGRRGVGKRVHKGIKIIIVDRALI